MRRVILAMVLALGLLSFGCSGGTDSEESPSPLAAGVDQGPADDAFYVPPPPPASAEPGDLIWARPLEGPPESTGFLILYWSRGLDDSLVAVSGVVFAPSAPALQPRPILTWGHGPFGMGDDCAPSKTYVQGRGASLPIVQAAIQSGFVFVGSDYRGLGTPGEHPFLVNQAAARDMLDAVRAADRLVGSGSNSEVILVGQSQGGGAALVGAELAPSYVPDMRVLAAVGVSVPSSLTRLDLALSGGQSFGYLPLTVAGYRAAYPPLTGDDVRLTQAGREAVGSVGAECADSALDTYANRSASEFGLDTVMRAPDFAEKLASNEPGRSRPGAPVLLVHGEQDETVPVQDSQDLLRRYCAIGARVSLSTYPGSGHIDVIGPAVPDIGNYLEQRLVGVLAPSGC